MHIRENSYFNEFLKTVEDNTNKNLHTENSMLIAVNFGSEVQKEEMRSILKDHNEKNELVCITSIARKYLTKNILDNMENKKLSNSIYKRL
jgi:hypothetical protein